MKHPSQVLIRPIITEKSMSDTSKGKFVFEICRECTKIDIKRAVEERFSVDVKSVRVLNLPAKPKRWGRHNYRKGSRRKAIVTLVAGQTIQELVEAV